MSIVTSWKDSVAIRSDGGTTANWQRAFRNAVRDPIELCRRLKLPARCADSAAARQFPVFAPLEYLARIRVGDPHDPLLRQILPLDEELTVSAGCAEDPVGDAAAIRAPGLLQKYGSRVLLITTGTCAVHCRYCFRRHFPYDDAPRTIDQWQAALDRIAEDDTIDEVIFSGGDPLTLVDDKLSALVAELEKIPHVKRLRIHTRLPVMIPSRVDAGLLRWLRASRLVPIVVIHANHANELDSHVGDALARLSHAGVPLLNQAVLLRGVNDNLDAQVALSRRLVNLRVMPYYLHQLDPVQGAAHFQVPLSKGRSLIEQMREHLPGYAVPRFVQEIPGATSKDLIA